MNTHYYAMPGLNRIEVQDQIEDAQENENRIVEIKPMQIINIVIRHLNDFKENDLSFKDIIVRKRRGDLPMYRFACFYFLKQYTMLTLKEIAERLGGYDHSTVIHGITTWGDYIDTYRGAMRISTMIENEIVKTRDVMIGK